LKEIDDSRKHISRSGWLKQAAEEKIERDRYREIKAINDFIKEK
jgi:hypothetical protein